MIFENIINNSDNNIPKIKGNTFKNIFVTFKSNLYITKRRIFNKI